jgi:hypothetical protein
MDEPFSEDYTEHVPQPEDESAPCSSPCSTLVGKWSISTNGENYQHEFDTLENAIAEGTCYGGRFYVGQCVAPVPPETLFDHWSVDQWIEQVREHDDYSGEWAADALAVTKEQQEELAAEIRPVIAAWLDRHKLRPTFWHNARR